MDKKIINRLGRNGECICPKCKALVKHKRSIPCHDTNVQNAEQKCYVRDLNITING